MSKSKRKNKNTQKKKLQRQDLSYKKAIEICCIDQKEIRLVQEQYIQSLKEMSEEIRRNMERYVEIQNELISAKLRVSSLEITSKSVDEIRKQYKEILEMYKRINNS